MDKDIAFSLADLSEKDFIETVRAGIVLYITPKDKYVKEETVLYEYCKLLEKL